MDFFSKILEFIKLTSIQRDFLLSVLLCVPLVFLMVAVNTSWFLSQDWFTQMMISFAVSISFHLAALFSLLLFQIATKTRYEHLDLLFFIPCHFLPIFFSILPLLGFRPETQELVKSSASLLVLFYGGFVIIGIFGRLASHVIEKYVHEDSDSPEKPADGEEHPADGPEGD